MDAQTLRDATSELPGGQVAVGDTIVDALVTTGVADSRNAARRLIGEGGVSLNNVKVSDADAVVTESDFINGEVAIVKRGRKFLAAARKKG